MARFIGFASIAAAAIFSVSAADAATFTESVQFGPGPTDYQNATGTTAGPNGNQLYYFDSNGGTLNSITLSYTYSVSSNITLTNTSSTSSNGVARIQSAVKFSANDSTIAAAFNSAVNTYVDPVDGTSVTFGSSTLSPIAADVRGTPINYTLTPGSSTSFSSNGGYSRSNYTLTDAAILAAFSRNGGGTFTPLLSTLSGLVVSNSGGNTTGTQATTAQANLVLSFNYSLPAPTPTPPSAVPEPASWAMLILGMGAVGYAMRRHRAVARVRHTA